VYIGKGGVGLPAARHAAKIGVNIINRTMITDLLKQDGRVVGAVGFSVLTGEMTVFRAKATVLAGGLCGWARGDGDAMSYRAGAELTTKEFPYTWPEAGVSNGWSVVAGRTVYMRFADADFKRIDTTNRYELDLTMEHLIHAGRGPLYWDVEGAKAVDIERMNVRDRLTYPNFSQMIPGLDFSKVDKMLVNGENRGHR